MAITVVNVSSRVEAATTTTSVVPTPASIQADDILIAGIGIATGSFTFTTVPTGWNVVDDIPNGVNNRLGTYWKKVVNGDPASYTWGCSSADNWASGMIAFRGVDPNVPIDQHASSGLNSALIIGTSPPITPTVDNCIIVAFFETDATNANGAGLIVPAAGTVTGTDRVSVQDGTNFETTEGQTYQQGARAAVTLAAQRTNGDTNYFAISIMSLAPALGADNTAKPAMAAMFTPDINARAWF